MKGITPVIAIVLLIIIVIAIISAVALNFQTLFQNSADTAREQTQETTDRLAQTIRIESAVDDDVVVRATGNTIDTAALAVFVDGVLDACDWDVASIDQDELATCDLAADCAGSVVKVTSPGNTVSITC